LVEGGGHIAVLSRAVRLDKGEKVSFLTHAQTLGVLCRFEKFARLGPHALQAGNQRGSMVLTNAQN
jgi:hypothetical protein